MLDSSATIELFAGFLKVRDVLCALRFVRVVDISISHGGCDECGRPMPLSVTLTGVCGRVGLGR